ncbi:DivIVA domain-containing protein [Raineyella antarctica]|uniref:Cell wall synthesis protein Wag31 n=1 Tax=Raineyella antarctica TaxID=1577474 RepID=A0A1G6GDA1_9ACTN|nr:DivIVA domain-containing protein [Raineyella antarctica]SDB79978.1 DivIVA domain-containing protein [Raineyella antarctica]
MANSEGFDPETIRHKEFSARMRGYETTEVADYLGDLADLIEDLQEENARLVSTNRDLRAELDTYAAGGAPQGQQSGFGDVAAQAPVSAVPEVAVSGQAEAILTRAQQMADQLMSDAEVEARQRVADAADVDLVDYVRTYARVTHDQLKGVIEQLDSQLDRLHDLASRDAHGIAWDSTHQG